MSKPAAPNRLGSLIQPKGAAPRPVEMPQRGQGVPAPTAEPVQPAPAEKPKAKPRSLTFKMTEEDYQRLRAYGFKHSMSHQKILDSLVLPFLDQQDT